MPRHKRPRSTSASAAPATGTASTTIPWKVVNVGIGADGPDTEENPKNHFDSAKLAKQASQDLPATPGEEMGIFYGLEVLDGSQYQVVEDGGNKRLKLVVDVPAQETEETSGPAKKSKKEKKRKKSKDDSKKNHEEKVAEHNVAAATNSSKTQPLSAKVKEGESSSKPWNKKIQSKFMKTSSEEETPQPKTQADGLPPASNADEKDEIKDDYEKNWYEIQQSWSAACGGNGVVLHERLCRALSRLSFVRPTPIQAATLNASILGRRNLVGAAPTGSGKTLAFLLPILQHLLEKEENKTDTNINNAVQALIVTPTRELATQIYQACESLIPNQTVTLVGGIAQVKQQRLLTQKKPSILIGTPGRLWAMISQKASTHLQDLSQIRFLVLDEADRMMQDHSFPQLVQILDIIHTQNPGLRGEESESEDDEETEEEEGGRLLGLPGIRGEASLQMLSPELLQQIEAQRQEDKPTTKEVDEDQFESVHPDDDKNDQDFIEALPMEDDEVDSKEPVRRQTFIYSATLTLPYTSTTAGGSTKKRHKSLPLEGGLAEILEKTRAMGETKVVDLSSTSVNDPSSTSTSGAKSDKQGVKLPPGLRLEHIKCTQRHKDSHLYAYLMTTVQGASGPALVFCNSIAAVRRVGITLQTLGLTVRILHAHMQQRARFKAVESLSKDMSNGSRIVVVCTDVAARGLDIPSVATVIHYDVARAVDTFVHRAGRTARGMGEGAVGLSLSLVAPAEDKAHSKITQAADVSFSKVQLDGRLLAASQERVNLASKVVAANEKSKKIQSRNQWFTEKAKEAEMELDEDILDEGLTLAEQTELRGAEQARARLAELLVQPMKTQRFGKFLSTNSSAMQAEIKPLPQATETLHMGTKRKA